MQEITITKVVNKGSNLISYNVDLNNAPFGQIWTFKAKGEKHGYHVKTLKGAYKLYSTYAEAERFIRGEM